VKLTNVWFGKFEILSDPFNAEFSKHEAAAKTPISKKKDLEKNQDPFLLFKNPL